MKSCNGAVFKLFYALSIETLLLICTTCHDKYFFIPDQDGTSLQDISLDLQDVFPLFLALQLKNELLDKGRGTKLKLFMISTLFIHNAATRLF